MRRFKTGWTRLPDGYEVGDVVSGMGLCPVRGRSEVSHLGPARPQAQDLGNGKMKNGAGPSKGPRPSSPRGHGFLGQGRDDDPPIAVESLSL